MYVMTKKPDGTASDWVTADEIVVMMPGLGRSFVIRFEGDCLRTFAGDATERGRDVGGIHKSLGKEV